MCSMVALGQLVLFSVSRNTVDISKLVARLVFSAGLSLLVHLTENRFSTQFRLPKSIGPPSRRKDENIVRYHQPPSILEDPGLFPLETKLPDICVQLASLNSTAKENLDGIQVTQSRDMPFVAGIIGVSFCLLFALVTASRVLSVPRGSKRRMFWTKDIPRDPQQTPLAGLLDNEREPREISPSPPGGYPRHFDIVFGVEDNDNKNSLSDYSFARAVPPPPPPPPPPPMYTSSVPFDDKRSFDFFFIVVLLPILAFAIKRLVLRLVSRMARKGKAPSTPSNRISVRSTASAGMCDDVIPLHGRKLPVRTRVIGLPRNSSLGRYISPFVGITNSIPIPCRLATLIISGVRLLRRIIKLVLLATFLLHSCVFYMVPMILVCVAWYYLPDLILSSLMSGKGEPRNCNETIGHRQATDWNNGDVDGLTTKVLQLEIDGLKSSQLYHVETMPI